MDMGSPVRAPAAVVAAGFVAIIGAALAALIIVVSFAALPRIDLSQSGIVITSAVRPVLYLTWTFFFLFAGFVLISGIFVIRLRNWARLSLLVVAGGALLFGVVGLGVIFAMIYFTPADPVVSKPVLASVLAFTYGIPILVAIWWLVLFTRRSVVEQFHAAAAAGIGINPPTPLLNNPECPLAIRAVGWYLASFILFLPFLPFLPSHLPALYFGHLFKGPSGILAHFLSFALFAIPGIGLLLLKRWSYVLTFGTQLLYCVNCLVIVLSPSFESNMSATSAELGVPIPPSTVLPEIRYLVLLTLVLPLAILVILYVYRRPFYAAAELASKQTTSS
jgi:hypothetical protein